MTSQSKTRQGKTRKETLQDETRGDKTRQDKKTTVKRPDEKLQWPGLTDIAVFRVLQGEGSNERLPEAACALAHVAQKGRRRNGVQNGVDGRVEGQDEDSDPGVHL